MKEKILTNLQIVMDRNVINPIHINELELKFDELYDLRNENPYGLPATYAKILRKKIGIYDDGEMQANAYLSLLFNKSNESIRQTLKMSLRFLCRKDIEKTIILERNKKIYESMKENNDIKTLNKKDISYLGINNKMISILNNIGIYKIDDLLKITIEDIKKLNEQYGENKEIVIFPNYIIDLVTTTGLEFTHENIFTCADNKKRLKNIKNNKLGLELGLTSRNIKIMASLGIETLDDLITTMQFDKERLIKINSKLKKIEDSIYKPYIKQIGEEQNIYSESSLINYINKLDNIKTLGMQITLKNMCGQNNQFDPDFQIKFNNLFTELYRKIDGDPKKLSIIIDEIYETLFPCMQFNQISKTLKEISKFAETEDKFTFKLDTETINKCRKNIYLNLGIEENNLTNTINYKKMYLPFTSFFDMTKANIYSLSKLETIIIRMYTGIYDNGNIQNTKTIAKRLKLEENNVENIIVIALSKLNITEFLEERNEYIKNAIEKNNLIRKKILNSDILFIKMQKKEEYVLRQSGINKMIDILNLKQLNIEIMLSYIGYSHMCNLLIHISDTIHAIGLEFADERLIQETINCQKKYHL